MVEDGFNYTSNTVLTFPLEGEQGGLTQNYQNPFDLSHSDFFLAAITILFVIAIFGIMFGFLYSIYFSYPSLMRSLSNRQRIQYYASGFGFDELTPDESINNSTSTIKTYHKNKRDGKYIENLISKYSSSSSSPHQYSEDEQNQNLLHSNNTSRNISVINQKKITTELPSISEFVTYEVINKRNNMTSVESV